ncbi:uncharacterized protein MONBRDRAFT_32405 [Monosiga brevicollis MX1]|uniref:Uncharacterized protein n=1 Tax=Monosiga brevicollis TaxID=81824 RepID=A9UZB9_MONBE|nr:uncharacterized protein MONBRDRAFT_32405 [Monosiga brevicollis MX1]EDQ89340.1 predicted protein [Monosiga brevicollis MX1]|eukprot:XP_001745916.1 hypothetical protein [Monosiga brevicollis MX1]
MTFIDCVEKCFDSHLTLPLRKCFDSYPSLSLSLSLSCQLDLTSTLGFEPNHNACSLAWQLYDLRMKHRKATVEFQQLNQAEGVVILRKRTRSLERRLLESLVAVQNMKQLLDAGQASAQLEKTAMLMKNRLDECKNVMQGVFDAGAALGEYAAVLHTVSEIETAFNSLQLTKPLLALKALGDDDDDDL